MARKRLLPTTFNYYVVLRVFKNLFSVWLPCYICSSEIKNIFEDIHGKTGAFTWASSSQHIDTSSCHREGRLVEVVINMIQTKPLIPQNRAQTCLFPDHIKTISRGNGGICERTMLLHYPWSASMGSLPSPVPHDTTIQCSTDCLRFG